MRCSLLFTFALLAFGSTPVRAEETPPVEPPRLTTFFAAELPEGTTPKEPITVLLELDVDASGQVTDSRIVGDAPSPFAEAAEAAVRRFRFEPARRLGVPIAVKIRYEYRFEAAAEPAAPAASRAPAAEKPVRAAPVPDTPPPAPPEEGFGATAAVEAPPREVTRHTIAQAELRTVPGTSGDALRAIEILPGVARTGVEQGDPILRGAAWNESRSFIEGDTVPLLFHFGGVKSAFNSALLERVDLYPGNFSSRFGRATGGILDVRVRDPRRDRWHGLLELSVLDSMALVETPVGPHGGVAVAARRSNVDFFYDLFVPKDAFRVVAAPT